jgi:hypothetical protein
MALTAKELSKSGARSSEIDAIIREQLRIIDEKLQRADRAWGRNVVPVGLPLTFGLVGLGKKESQRIVYAEIIKSLKDRGFEVNILIEKMQTVLYVAWVTDLNQEEIDAMNKIIAGVRIQASDIDRVMGVEKRGAAADPPKTSEPGQKGPPKAAYPGNPGDAALSGRPPYAQQVIPQFVRDYRGIPNT